MVVDLFLVFQFIRKLVTPFNKWPAFEQGIIDEKGDILIKRKQFTKKASRKGPNKKKKKCKASSPRFS